MFQTLLLISILLIPQIILSQTQYSLETVWDSRAASLGHNGILGSNGANAVFMNPANLAILTDVEVNICGRLSKGSITDDYDYLGINEYDITTNPKLTQITFGMPLKISTESVTFVGALGYNTLMDFRSKLNGEGTIVDPRGNDYYTYLESTSTGSFSTLTPSIALGFKNGFRMGLAYNFPFMSKSTSDFEFGEVKSNWRTKLGSESKFSGSYLLIGISVKPSSRIGLGITYRSILKLREDRNEFGSDGIKTHVKRSVELPAIFGFALSYKTSPSSTFFLEYQSRNFSKRKFVNYEGVSGVNDGKVIKLGLEHVQGNFPFRIGYYRESIPITDGGFDDRKPLPLIGYTVGIGYDAGSAIKIDSYIDYSKFTKSYTDGSYIDGGEYRQSIIKFGLTLAYSF